MGELINLQTNGDFIYIELQDSEAKKEILIFSFRRDDVVSMCFARSKESEKDTLLIYMRDFKDRLKLFLSYEEAKKIFSWFVNGIL